MFIFQDTPSKPNDINYSEEGWFIVQSFRAENDKDCNVFTVCSMYL